MPLPLPGSRVASILVVVLATSVGSVASGDDLAIVARAGDPGAVTSPSLAALRLDNYVDVVDSVLNDRVRPRGEGPSAPPRPIATEPSPRAASGDVREDTLNLSRATRPPRLPTGPLVVTTTAAFDGEGTPAGAATWPPVAGRLSIRAADGSRIELDADTGDIASVDVTIVSGTRLHTFREPWATWAPWVLSGR